MKTLNIQGHSGYLLCSFVGSISNSRYVGGGTLALTFLEERLNNFRSIFPLQAVFKSVQLHKIYIDTYTFLYIYILQNVADKVPELTWSSSEDTWYSGARMHVRICLDIL